MIKYLEREMRLTARRYKRVNLKERKKLMETAACRLLSNLESLGMAPPYVSVEVSPGNVVLARLWEEV